MFAEDKHSTRVRKALASVAALLDGHGPPQHDGEGDGVEFNDVMKMNDQRLRDGTGTFTSVYDANVNGPARSPKSRMNQVFTGNRKIATDLNEKLDLIYSEMTEKFETLNEHIRRIDTQVANNAMSIRREDGFLPGRTDTNPRKHCNVVALRSGRQLTPGVKKGITIDEFAKIVMDEKEKSHPVPLEINEQDPEISLGTEKLDQADFEELIAEPKNQNGEVSDIDRHSSTSIERQPELHIDRHSRSKIERYPDSEPTEPIKTRVYEARPPFPPKNAKKRKKLIEKAICKKAFDKMIIELPLSDAVHISPAIKQYMKDAASRGFDDSEHCVMMVSEEASELIQGKTPVKLPDPGSFVLDCIIGNERFQRSLCDLGSSVNLMPYSVAVVRKHEELV